MLSVVIPIHNEESSIVSLHDRLTEVLDSLAQPYEIIFVDDGSTDRSFKVISNLPDDGCAAQSGSFAPQLRPDGGALRWISRSSGRGGYFARWRPAA